MRRRRREDEPAHEALARRVEPVQVFDDDDERLRRRQPDQVADQAEQLVLPRLGIDRAGAAVADAEEVGEQIGVREQSRGERAERLSQAAARLRGRRARRQVQPVAEQLEDRLVRRRMSVGQGPHRQDTDPVRATAQRELVAQATLADAGRRRDSDDARLAFARARERLVEHRHLAAAADEAGRDRRRRDAGRRIEGQQLVDADGLVEALDRTVADKARIHMAADELECRRTEVGRPGGSELLDSAGQVQRRAESAVAKIRAAQLRRDQIAGMQADADERMRRQAGQRRMGRLGGATRQQRVAFERPRRAEQRQDAVAGDTDDRAFEVLRGAAHGIEHRPQHHHRLFRIEPGDGARRADDIDEHHGGVLALGIGRAQRQRRGTGRDEVGAAGTAEERVAPARRRAGRARDDQRLPAMEAFIVAERRLGAAVRTAHPAQAGKPARSRLRRWCSR